MTNEAKWLCNRGRILALLQSCGHPVALAWVRRRLSAFMHENTVYSHVQQLELESLVNVQRNIGPRGSLVSLKNSA